MNYFSLLCEMQETHAVALFSAHPGWSVRVSRHGDVRTEQQSHADTPEAAIRAIYLQLNPIKSTSGTGKLSLK